MAIAHCKLTIGLSKMTKIRSVLRSIRKMNTLRPLPDRRYRESDREIRKSIEMRTLNLAVHGWQTLTVKWPGSPTSRSLVPITDRSWMVENKIFPIPGRTDRGGSLTSMDNGFLRFRMIQTFLPNLLLLWIPVSTTRIKPSKEVKTKKKWSSKGMSKILVSSTTEARTTQRASWPKATGRTFRVRTTTHRTSRLLVPTAMATSTSPVRTTKVRMMSRYWFNNANSKGRDSCI